VTEYADTDTIRIVRPPRGRGVMTYDQCCRRILRFKGKTVGQMLRGLTPRNQSRMRQVIAGLHRQRMVTVKVRDHGHQQED
jgi:hypothetical protein